MGMVKCLKGLLVVVNVIFMLAGLAFFGGGVYVYINGESYGITPTVAIGVIVTGLAVALVAIFGLVGASKNSKPLLWIVRVSFFFFRVSTWSDTRSL